MLRQNYRLRRRQKFCEQPTLRLCLRFAQDKMEGLVAAPRETGPRPVSPVEALHYQWSTTTPKSILGALTGFLGHQWAH